MSLYHEAAEIIGTASSEGGSFKSLSFNKQRGWKSDPKTLFALTTEAAKWSEVLSEVIEKSNVLDAEKQLTPTLALLLTHDLLLAKKGVALPSSHGLHTTIARHKARLQAELTKARIRRGCPNVEALRTTVNSRNHGKQSHPRWIRINTLATSLEDQMASTFAEHSKVDNLATVMNAGPENKLIYIDHHIPNLVAIPPGSAIATTTAFQKGMILLQDKASCFPAYLLNPTLAGGDIIDACAAPGNKTTHLAAIVASNSDSNNEKSPTVIACEKDSTRSVVLASMVNKAHADRMVQIKPDQDFMKLTPRAKEFENVTSLLLDPSCSGSGIVGRDEVTVTVRLPATAKTADPVHKGKKRKRNGINVEPKAKQRSTMEAPEAEEAPLELGGDTQNLRDRLSSLSEFQLTLLKRAMSFPAARRISYSTCSLYNEENENVVVKALLSDIAMERGWNIMKRDEQPDGLQKWNIRGNREAVVEMLGESRGQKVSLDVDDVSDACIRCVKSAQDGTMGFFVAGFVRHQDDAHSRPAGSNPSESRNAMEVDSSDAEDEWNGFSDEDQ